MRWPSPICAFLLDINHPFCTLNAQTIPTMYPSNRINRNNRGLSLGGLLAIIGLVALVFVSLLAVRVYTVAGNSVGVVEDWNGVRAEPLGPGTYFYVFNPSSGNKTVYSYPISGRVFVMNDKDDNHEPFANGRRSDTLLVNSLDNQQVKFHITLTWHIDPAHVVSLHKTYRDNIEERLIRSEVVNEVGIRATLQNAIDLYSGPKLNALRETVTNELRDAGGRLAQNGVIVDRFVIEKPQLNAAYETIIEQRQLNIATESQQKELEKANVATANAAKAAALRQQYEEIVAAETDKKRSILQQEATSQKAIIAADANAKNVIVTQTAESEKVVIAAKAEASRNVAISEAQKQAEINRAVGIEAVGRAEASANQLKLTSYSVAGSDVFMRIEVAKSYAAANAMVKFYPSNATFNTIAKDFDQGLNLLVGQAAPATK